MIGEDNSNKVGLEIVACVEVYSHVYEFTM